MKARNALLTLLAAAVFAMIGLTGLSQPVSAVDDVKKLAEAVREASTANEFFGFLKPLRKIRGKREHSVTWWSGAGATPVEARATGDVEWVSQNRAISQKIEGNWLGVSFEATVFLAYDNTLGRYTCLWSDTLANRTLFFSGKPNESGNVVTFTAETGDAVSREPVTIRCVLNMPDRSGEMKTEFYRTDTGGTEYKFMEVVSKRRIIRAG